MSASPLPPVAHMDVVLILWMALCACQDARQKRISNLLTLGASAAGLLYLLGFGQTLLGASPWQAAVAVAAALALSLPGYLLNRLGAADVKLLLAVALLGTPHTLLWSVCGAALAVLIWTAVAGTLWPHLPATLQRWIPMLGPQHLKRAPYAPFLFIGFAVSVLTLT